MATPNNKFAYLPATRLHVNAGWKWAHEVGTDYWLQPTQGALGSDQAAAAVAHNGGTVIVGPKLAENGWLTTSLVNTIGEAASFRGGAFTPGTGKNRDGSFADTGTPNHFLTDADNDLLESPAMFGNADHMQAATEIAGMRNLPNILGVSFWGAMTANSADQKDAAWGFWQDGGSALTASEAIAAIYSDSANFALQAADAVVGSAGLVVDTAWHYFRLELEFNGFITWWIDGALQERNTVTITADQFPCSFGFAGSGTNRPGLGLTHVYYDWGSGRS